ncbi:MAG: UDP-N-acetylglucosamine 1-carboxyvinyltransferase [Sphaerochaetaceae bacterium]|jgi:UDP-N-acetylglucosamine 1-carboxyvinyltransferase|nr:UDP-N-acetylglucosamine 1-carboxyvinyltransferase [Sphaerochaetaceae bacterium]
MESFEITGGQELHGSITVSGNKNAALPCLAATLLSDEPIILHNIPVIQDVNVMLELLKFLGSQVEWIGKNSLKICTGSTLKTTQHQFPPHLVDAIRASLLLAGPMVARTGAISLPPPGGDVIGFRRLDTHFFALEALGGTCLITKEGFLEITTSQLIGTAVFLDEASVTATENVIMAAVLAEGITRISNAASEPHVQDLCNMLVAMGAVIEGIGSNLLTITGVRTLQGASFQIGPDYMEVGSFIGLVGATGGSLELCGIDITQLPMLATGFERIGITWEITGPQSLFVPAQQSRIIKKTINGQTHKIDDAPWPGFPADLLSIITVAATQMHGSILIHEKMYESRMFFVDWLIRMGADIILCDPHRAIVNGPIKLKPAEVTSPDVRAGMALVIAALCANGVSTIQNIYQIERGYERLAEKLLSLGAKIKRLP